MAIVRVNKCLVTGEKMGNVYSEGTKDITQLREVVNDYNEGT